jgi:hypothetical protein
MRRPSEQVLHLKTSPKFRVHLFDWPQLERAEANGITFLLLAGQPDVSATFSVSVKGGKLHVAAAA